MIKLNKKTYTKEQANAKGLVRINSWLKAAGIKAHPSQVEGCDLAIQAADGRFVQVKVAMTADEPRPGVEHLFALAGELTHRNADTALRAFHAITQAVGFGSPQPIDRGPAPSKKLMYDDNFELVAMRHKEFRKVPNPSTAELAQYDGVINKAVSRFMSINSKICRRHVIESQDLKTYAQIWACNYLGLYKVANPTANDNERKMSAHLCQRFGNFIEVLLKKERNCISEADTVSVALYGRPAASTSRRRGRSAELAEADYMGLERERDEAEIVEEEYGDDSELFAEAVSVPDHDADATEEQKERKVTEALRRKEAQASLAAALGSMDHDTMVATLLAASENSFLCYDARAEARKQLRVHAETCPLCAKMKEELAGEDADGE